MSKSIWERRLEIERQERAERHLLLETLHKKYDPLYERLVEECEKSEKGHEWRFTTFGVGGQSFYKCNYCAKGKSE